MLDSRADQPPPCPPVGEEDNADCSETVTIVADPAHDAEAQPCQHNGCRAPPPTQITSPLADKTPCGGDAYSGGVTKTKTKQLAEP